VAHGEVFIFGVAKNKMVIFSPAERVGVRSKYNFFKTSQENRQNIIRGNYCKKEKKAGRYCSRGAHEHYTNVCGDCVVYQ
jgi:hypothetical protein